MERENAWRPLWYPAWRYAFDALAPSMPGTVLREELFQRTREPVERDLLERVRRAWMDLELAARQLSHRGSALLDGHRRVAIPDADPHRLRDAREQLVGNARASAELVQELRRLREQGFPPRSRVTRLQCGREPSGPSRESPTGRASPTRARRLRVSTRALSRASPRARYARELVAARYSATYPPML